MHGATFTGTATTFLGHDFFHHFANITALGDTVAVAPVGRDNIVIVIQVHTHAGGDCLLACVQVQETGDITLTELITDAIFKIANRFHRPVGFQELLFI